MSWLPCLMLPMTSHDHSSTSDSIWGHLSLAHCSRGGSCLSTQSAEGKPSQAVEHTAPRRWTRGLTAQDRPTVTESQMASPEGKEPRYEVAETSEHSRTPVRPAAHLALIPSFPSEAREVKEQAKQVRASPLASAGERCWLAAWTQRCTLRGGCAMVKPLEEGEISCLSSLPFTSDKGLLFILISETLYLIGGQLP